MDFKKALFGLDSCEVEDYIRSLNDHLEKKEQEIKELNSRIMRLEFDKEQLKEELKAHRSVLRTHLAYSIAYRKLMQRPVGQKSGILKRSDKSTG